MIAMRPLFLLLVLLLLLPYMTQGAEPVILPAWQKDWLRIIEIPGAPTELRYATVSQRVSFAPAQERETVDYTLSGTLNETGSITVGARDGVLLGFTFNRRLPIEQRIIPPGGAQLREIALAFARALFPPEHDVEVVVRATQEYTPAKLYLVNRDLPGRVTIDYRYRDVALRTLVVQVDPQGYVVKMSVDDLARNLGRNVLPDIPPSPGEAVMRQTMLDAISAAQPKDLRENGVIIMEHLRRCLTYEQQNPRITWVTDADWYAGEPGASRGSHRGEYTYDEATKAMTHTQYKPEIHLIRHSTRRPPGINTCSHVILNQIRPPLPEPPMANYSVPNALVWSPDGRQIWGHANAQWTEHSFWELAPSSLVVTDIATGRIAAYRPLVDAIAGIRYENPCLSPDGRWLACLISRQDNPYSKRIVICDLARNRLYPAGGRYGIFIDGSIFSLAWRSDSAALIYSTRETICTIDAAEVDGVPFAARPRKYRLGKRVTAVAYLPGDTDACVASITDEVEIKPKLVRVQLQPDGATTMTTLFEDTNWLEEIRRIQALPDGKQLLFSRSSSLYQFDLDTKQVKPLTWINKGWKNGDTRMWLEDGFNWCVSPDGRQLAFIACGSPFTQLLAIADIDGTNLRIVPTDQHADRLPRYAPNGRDAVISYDTLSVPLAAMIYGGHTPTWTIPKKADENAENLDRDH